MIRRHTGISFVSRLFAAGSFEVQFLSIFAMLDRSSSVIWKAEYSVAHTSHIIKDIITPIVTSLVAFVELVLNL